MNSSCLWNDKGSLRRFRLRTVSFCSLIVMSSSSPISTAGIGHVYALISSFPSLGRGRASINGFPLKSLLDDFTYLASTGPIRLHSSYVYWFLSLSTSVYQYFQLSSSIWIPPTFFPWFLPKLHRMIRFQNYFEVLAQLIEDRGAIGFVPYNEEVNITKIVFYGSTIIQ